MIDEFPCATSGIQVSIMIIVSMLTTIREAALKECIGWIFFFLKKRINRIEFNCVLLTRDTLPLTSNKQSIFRSCQRDQHALSRSNACNLFKHRRCVIYTIAQKHSSVVKRALCVAKTIGRVTIVRLLR